MLGQTICGRYRIIRQIGRGGFGSTFLAFDTQRPGNPQCVVKQFKPMATDPLTLQHAKRLFDQEAEMLEILGNHDQIPRLLAHCEEKQEEEKQEFYIVQEFIQGHDLNQEIFSGRQLSETEVIKLLKDILEVLAFVHQKQVIHRDLKPSNIMRRESDGKIVLIDFGAVKQVSTQITNAQGHTTFTIAIGTSGYKPSEQANGKPKLSSDIYAVGVICIYALTGINPIFPTDPLTGEIVWRNQAHVSSKLADIIDKMVRYDYRQRYQSADEVLEGLKTLLLDTLVGNQTQKQPDTKVPTTQPPTQLPGSSKKLLIGSGIAAVVATSVVAINILKPPTPESFLQYENSNFGIKIKYPQSWERQDINNAITGEVVTFLSPKQSDADKIQEKVTISIENFSGTLQEFQDSIIKENNNNISKAKNTQSNNSSLANKPGKRLVFTGKSGEKSLQHLQVFTLKGEQVYVITYTAEKDNYDEFIETAETMMKSFEIQ